MINFLKKFKEKILIALACSFIGIGTLLSNSIETKAYVSDDFSYTLTYLQSSNNSLYYFTLNDGLSSRKLNEYVFLVNLTMSQNWSSNGSLTLRYYDSNSSLTSYVKSDNLGSYTYPYGSTNYILYHSTTSSSYSFDTISINFSGANIGWGVIKNIDYIPITQVSTLPYINDVYGNLQTQYDSLQAEYTSYQNTHAYTNEQYNDLMTQNATLTQQVQTLQSQYDTYVSLHTYTNEQYETLLTNYNNLQNMYSNLQASYLVLQQQYDSLALSVAPFTSSKWNNRTGSLNGVTYDMQNMYRDSLVSFEKTYLFISARDLDVFDNYSTGSNTFVLTAFCNQNVVLSGFNVIANLSHIREESFQIDFYLDNNLVYSTIDFDNDMGDDDSNTISVDRFLEFNQITITVVVTYDSLYSSYGYFNAVVGTWQDGYDYAVGQLMPQINRLEDELQVSNAQQQVKYSEGYTNGFNDANSQPLYGMIIRIL